MKYLTQLLFLILSVFITLNEAQHVEIPSDMRYVCPASGYSSLPVDEPYFPDPRLKRQQPVSIGARVDNLKKTCIADLGMGSEEIPEDLLNFENPTPKQKCLVTCILQRLQLMTKNNRISIKGIEQLANEFGNFNPLVTSIAIALAEQYNERLTALKTTDQCEIGFLINQYIAKEMADRKLKLPY